MKNYIMIPLLVMVGAFTTQAQISDLKIEKNQNKLNDISYIPATEKSFKGGFNELLDYVLPAPYQGNAGSCLFMSHTGAVEWWMNKLAGYKKYDLSERYFMNLQKDEVGAASVKNWKTDTIERINQTRKFYDNFEFRFTKGWYKIKNGTRQVSDANDPKSKYSEKYNWVVEYQNLKTWIYKIRRIEAAFF